MTPLEEFNKLFLDREEEEKDIPKDKRNMYPPPTDPQLFVNVIIDLLLGEKWYVTDPLPNSQVNTIALHEILMKHSKKYRKMVKQYKKKLQLKEKVEDLQRTIKGMG